MSDIISFFVHLRSVLYDRLILPFRFARVSKSKQRSVSVSSPVTIAAAASSSSSSSSAKGEEKRVKMGSKDSVAGFPTTEPAMKISVSD